MHGEEHEEPERREAKAAPIPAPWELAAQQQTMWGGEGLPKEQTISHSDCRGYLSCSL